MTNDISTQHLTIDTTSHIDAGRNRNLLRGTFMFLQQVPALTHQQRIDAMSYMKGLIRKRDAEPAAWSRGPSRAKWVEARIERGELQTDEQIGRALTGNEEPA
ncbi:hypothetical protein [Halomonas sp. BC04]|uniref:hypothetical protein n=1 Tax=Halomonas sp. BC04 TaxID=1403540 RepID=UPI0003ED7722|nr:hypothetical protein [Halomonas sp. BC04]EWG99908.1 hypothetical protein Q427_22130 [Halomonas sp. BC04]